MRSDCSEIQTVCGIRKQQVQVALHIIPVQPNAIQTVVTRKKNFCTHTQTVLSWYESKVITFRARVRINRVSEIQTVCGIRKQQVQVALHIIPVQPNAIQTVVTRKKNFCTHTQTVLSWYESKVITFRARVRINRVRLPIPLVVN